MPSRASAQSAPAASSTAPETARPNILVIFGDDVGQANISAYSLGVGRLQDAKYRQHRQGRHDVHGPPIAKRNGVVIHTIGIGDPAATGEDELDTTILQKIAADTVGGYRHGYDERAISYQRFSI